MIYYIKEKLFIFIISVHIETDVDYEGIMIQVLRTNDSVPVGTFSHIPSLLQAITCLKEDGEQDDVDMRRRRNSNRRNTLVDTRHPILIGNFSVVWTAPRLEQGSLILK